MRERRRTAIPSRRAAFVWAAGMESSDGFAFTDLSGVIVHDRYQNYDKIPA